MTKIVTISDLHDDLEIIKFFVNYSLKHNTFLFVSGDITKMESGRIEEILKLFNKTKTLLIPGNNERYSFLEKYIKNFENITLKNFDLFDYFGIKVLTIPGNSEIDILNYWDEDKVSVLLKKLTNNFKEKVNIILSHLPPFGILDSGRGSMILREIYEKISFDFFICGHEHSFMGEYFENNGKIILNPGKIGFLIDLENKSFKKILPF